MVSSLDEALQQLQEVLHDTKEYQNYHKLRSFIDANPSYVQREEELKLMQKDMVQFLNDQRYDDYQATKRNYEQLKQEFDSDPAVVQYQLVKEDLNDLLIEIAQLIETGIQNLKEPK